jgi:tripartite-type tricarboxylate transporter receptor subunit TctC
VSNLMIVHPSNPAKTAQDVIAQAKAKPGELTFSSGGNGTSHHLSGVLFASMAGINTVHVPYKGAPQGITAVMSKEVTMGFFNTPTVISQVRDGRLKALAATSKTRTPFFPDVPTLDESGLKGYEVTVWFGFAGPARLPDSTLERLYGEMVKIMKDPAVREKLSNLGFELMPQLPPAEFGKLIQSDLAKWVPIVKASGATVD